MSGRRRFVFRHGLLSSAAGVLLISLIALLLPPIASTHLPPPLSGFSRSASAEPEPSTTTLIDGTDSDPANDVSTDPAISADGRYVAFRSLATNLVTPDTSDEDIYIRDGAGTAIALGANGGCNRGCNPTVSSDGRYVAFDSGVALLQEDTNGLTDVYVLDRSNGSYTRVSRRTNGDEAVGGDSYYTAISPDGRFIVFTSDATNLDSSIDDTNQVSDVFVRDRDTDEDGIFDEPGAVSTKRASVGSAGEGNGSSTIGDQMSQSAISADGHYVVFTSYASNLIGAGNDTNDSRDVFVRDMWANTTDRVSVNDGEGQADHGGYGAEISATGQYVTFGSESTNLFPDLPTCNGGGTCPQYYVRDLIGQTTSLVSADANQTPGNGITESASISGNGRFVAFSSYASNLLEQQGDTNGLEDVFVKDMGTAGIARVSLTSSGGQVEGCCYSRFPSISSDGRRVAFETRSTVEMVPGVSGFHIYLRYTPAPSIPEGQAYGRCGDSTHAPNTAYCEAEPVNTATGSYLSQATDASLPGIGIPFAFTRSYNSSDSTVGAFGRGWTHSYAIELRKKWNDDMTLRSEDGKQARFMKNPDGTYTGLDGAADRLVKLEDGSYQLTRKDQLVYTFNAAGQLTSLRDRNSQGLTFSYNGSSQLSTITDSVGRTITLSYTSGLLTQVSLPDGRSASYGYTNGLLTSAVDLRGGTTTYTYGSSKRLTKIVDQNLHTVVKNTYGSDGRVTQQVDGLGKVSTFSWNPQKQTSTFTDARGNVWKDVYSNNVLIQRINPLGQTTIYGYDGHLNLTSVKDPRGNTTTMTYDSNGNLLSRQAPTPLSYREEWTYDSRNNVATYTDGRHNVTTFTYDTAGNLISIARPLGVTTTFGRDPTTGQVTSVTDNGHTTSYQYDAQGNMTRITSSLGNQTTMGYDSSGRMTTMVDPRGNLAGANPTDYTWTYQYNNGDLVTSVTDPLGHATTWTYDPVALVMSRTDANVHSVNYTYDADNRLKTVAAPGNIVTTYGYNNTGDLITRTDANNHVTTWTYDLAHRLSTTTSPTNQVWTNVYDANGNLKKLIYPDAGIITYTYNVVNRPILIDYSDSTPDVSIVYDANGNRVSMTDGAGTLSYTFNTLDRLTQLTRGNDTFSYVWS